MIKAGIYGSATLLDPVRKQLLRLLLRHPDVDLRMVASPAGNTAPIAELHPVFAGETSLTLERIPDLDKLDLLFVIDEENLTEEIMEKFRNEPEFKLIVLGESPNLRRERPEDFVYGLAEYNRKQLVRGARAAFGPRAEAMLIELALFPLAKNALLEGDVKVEMATNRPYSLTDAAEEALVTLTEIQPEYTGAISATALPEAPYERLDIHATLHCPLAIEEIDRLYEETYSDHGFVYILPASTELEEDLRGSNKCLIQLRKEGDNLIIGATLDALTKGCTGTAVHIMDLLFGLHERTGLSI